MSDLVRQTSAGQSERIESRGQREKTMRLCPVFWTNCLMKDVLNMFQGQPKTVDVGNFHKRKLMLVHNDKTVSRAGRFVSRHVPLIKQQP
ncbi:MAG: hypothetical protein LBU65_03535 [Planctomycetaceae bacterium]|nr:hypothetical protein [Planctomycetaceae bacterium]